MGSMDEELGGMGLERMPTVEELEELSLYDEPKEELSLYDELKEQPRAMDTEDFPNNSLPWEELDKLEGRGLKAAGKELEAGKTIDTRNYRKQLRAVGMEGMDVMGLINSSKEEFRRMSGSYSELQVGICKEVRKKGRNKQHATNCRARKDQEVETLKAKFDTALAAQKRIKATEAELLTEKGVWEMRLVEKTLDMFRAYPHTL